MIRPERHHQPPLHGLGINTHTTPPPAPSLPALAARYAHALDDIAHMVDVACARDKRLPTSGLVSARELRRVVEAARGAW